MSIESKPNRIEACVGQLQEEVLVVKQRVASIEKNSTTVEATLKEFDVELGDVRIWMHWKEL